MKEVTPTAPTLEENELAQREREWLSGLSLSIIQDRELAERMGSELCGAAKKYLLYELRGSLKPLP